MLQCWHGCIAFFLQMKHIYGNCWTQKKAAEADERHVMQWKHAKPAALVHTAATPRPDFLFFFSKRFASLFLTLGGWGGQLNDFTKRQRATTAGWERRRLTRTDPRLADSIFWMLVLLSNLPTPLLICAGERISFHQLMNIHEGRVFDAQAAEKMWGLMSERCCSENWPPPISSTPPVDNDRVSFSVWNSFVLLWIIMFNRLYNFACNYWCAAL